MNKKVFFSIFLCLLIGTVSAYFLYKSYKNEEVIASSFKEKNLYFIQVGAFSEYKNVDTLSKSLPSYLVSEEGGLYIIYVGISMNKKNINKLNELYNEKGFSTFIKTKKVKNEEFIKTLEKYDTLLLESNDYDMIININKQVLKKYKEECLWKH